MSLATATHQNVPSAHTSRQMPWADVDPSTGYFSNIDEIRKEEYPMFQDTTYLDHAGTTIYAKSLVTAISEDLTRNLFGNPHSGSASSQLSTRRIDDTRVQLLRFLKADPDLFDLVFVANTTAAVKLVADAFRDQVGGFSYSYHVDSHTSVVGVRELAVLGSQCLNDHGVEQWLSGVAKSSEPVQPYTLFGYPGQSNLSGYRPPLAWCSKVYNLRRESGHNVFTLYDAAARLATAPMDLSNHANAPDFTALSLYKIFGLPDLGALVIRKECSDLFHNRRYFAGGTVDMVISLGEQWHASKESSIHSRLEDGTLPFHSIIALGSALATHSRLFGSMHNISRHTSFLSHNLYHRLSSLRHTTGLPVCQLYTSAKPDFGQSQGATLAFNLQDANGNWIGKSEVEKLASIKNIQFRTGGLCNPGGIATHLGLSASELRRNFASGQKCGDDNDVLNGKPTGMIRVSFGAMSSLADADKLVEFVEEFFLGRFHAPLSPPPSPRATPASPDTDQFWVQSLSVFPIKSCAAFKIPPGVLWEAQEEGLAWDREWCLVHQGTGMALNQKRYPTMAMIRPTIDLGRRALKVQHDIQGCEQKHLEISLDLETGQKSLVQTCNSTTSRSATVCGERQEVLVSNSIEIADFFSQALGVPCTLAKQQRPPPPTTSDGGILPGLDAATRSMPGHFPAPAPAPPTTATSKPTLLANESPILLISQSSVDSLNRDIQSQNVSAAIIPADSFRANIVIAQDPGQTQVPYAEDHFTSLQIGDDSASQFRVMGPCHRCQMVCVDQQSGQRKQEPFSTLAKTRRMDGKVWFGMHLSLVVGEEMWRGPSTGGVKREEEEKKKKRYVRIGDVVKVSW